MTGIALLLLLAPLALAQEHAHNGNEGMVMILYDGAPDGRAVVGSYTHFGFVLIDKEGNVAIHENAEFVVLQGITTLFSTTDTHEYDGIFSIDIVFTQPGPYQIIGTSGKMQLGVFQGEAVLPVDEGTLGIEFATAPIGPPGSRTIEATLSLVDPQGALIPHTDAIVEFRDAASGALASRTHLHIHEEPITFTQGLGPGTSFVANVIAYKASANDPDFRAVVAEFPVEVGPVAAPSVPMPQFAPPRVLTPKGATASADGYTLQGMYDPNSQVGIGQTARIAAVFLEDEGHAPVQHVDFEFALAGPRGVVFFSSALHEYDGVFEYVFIPDFPGTYEGTITARVGDHELTVPVQLFVIPPAVPVLGGAGPIRVSVDGLDGIVAGLPVNLTFSAMGPAGPAKHSEVDVTIFHPEEAPIYQFKLHAHAEGVTNAIVTLPHEGDWLMRIDTLPTVPEPSIHETVVLPFTVAPGLAGSPAILDDVPPAANIPGASVLFAALALLGASFWRRAR